LRGEIVSTVRQTVGTPTKKERVSRANLLLAHDAATTKKMRVKLFIRLWLHNALSRGVTVTALLFALPQIPTRLLQRVERAAGKPIERKRAFGSLEMLESSITSDTATLIHAILDRDLMTGVSLRRIVLTQTFDVVGSIVVAQIMLALLQTVLDLKYHSPRGTLTKAAMLSMAKKLEGADSVSTSMTVDQVRVSLADALAAGAKSGSKAE